MAIIRSSRPPPPSHKIFLSSIFLLLLLASLLLLLRRQASDHLALLRAYSSHARRLKLQSSRLLRLFSDLSSSLLSLSSSDLSSPLLEKDAKDRLKLARLLLSEHKDPFDTHLKIQKLTDTVFSVREQLLRSTKLGSLSARIAAGSTPKSLHCLAMRLMGEKIAHPERYPPPPPPREILDPDLFHFVVFSDNVVAVSVVVSSVVRNAGEPGRVVVHVVTDRMYAAAMEVWFARRPPAKGARVEVRSAAEFGFLNGSYSLDYLRFYLAEMFPGLGRVVCLEDDVVVQGDLGGLWRVDLGGMVNGAVEMCFGGFRRFGRYLNFSHPAVRERFGEGECAWGFGVNVFDLDAWRRERCTQKFHWFQNLVWLFNSYEVLFDARLI